MMKENQSGEKKSKTKIVAVAGIVVTVGLVLAAGVGASVRERRSRDEALDTLASDEHIQQLLGEYDPDGAFLVEYGLAQGDDISAFYEDYERTVDVIGTVVHEEFHEYSKTTDGYERLYMGEESSLDVPYTEVYHTKKMSGSVPDQCQTLRFDTYISEPSSGLAANEYGAYGLLNEFCAYSWGMNNTICMRPYYETFSDSVDTWRTWISLGASDRMAYAEFKYYILHYLQYAKKHYPQVYEGIMANEAFKTVYTQTEARFADAIAEYEKELHSMGKKLSHIGTTVTLQGEGRIQIDRWFEDFGDSIDLLYDEYAVLLEELQKPKYVKLHEALTGV